MAEPTVNRPRESEVKIWDSHVTYTYSVDKSETTTETRDKLEKEVRYQALSHACNVICEGCKGFAGVGRFNTGRILSAVYTTSSDGNETTITAEPQKIKVECIYDPELEK